MKGIKDKVAIVTGGASGIGAAACRRFVEEGAQVVIADINIEVARALAQDIGSRALAVQFDAEYVESAENMVNQAVEHFGKLDFLFNNAALMSPDIIKRDTNPVDIDFNLWDKVMRVNVRGYLAGCKYAIPHLLKSSSPAIVMTASGSGLLGDVANIAYGASKAAVMSMVRYIATQYGKQGLRCNAVNPGLTRTEGGKKNVYGPMVQIMQNNTLSPRLGRAEDIAAMAVFLCSDDGYFINAQSISVDGGMLSHMPYFSDFLTSDIQWDLEPPPEADTE